MANNENINKVIYGDDTLIDLTSDTVAQADVLSGTTFHDASGTAKTGTMPNHGADDINITRANTRVLISEGYHNGNGSAGISTTEASKITASNIKSGVTILGVEGSVSPAKNEQAKTVTATTTQQVVTPDVAPLPGNTLSSVTVNPQVHSDTYTPTGYSNAKDMGAQHNYRYVDTSGYEPTYIPLNSINDVYRIQEYKTYECTHGASYALNPHIVAGLGTLTPSDSSPQHIFNNSIYQASGEGYAIESQPTSVTPSSTPASVSSGDIVKIGGSGVIVDAVPTPTSLTPSNSDPAQIINGTLYSAEGNGFAVERIESMSPSDSSPRRVTKNSIYFCANNGYAIEEYYSVAPSDTNLQTLYKNTFYKPSDTGYFYKSQHVSQIVATIMGRCAGATSYTKYGIVANNQSFYDTNYFDLVNGSLVAKRAFSGYLYLYASSGRNSQATYIYGYVQVRKNGTTLDSCNTNSSSNSASKNLAISVAVGDTIDVYSHVNSGSSFAFTSFNVGIKTVAQPS